MNCCEITLFQNGGKIHLEFDCEAHHDGLCKHQGKWTEYAGGKCEHAAMGDSIGCWCKNKAAQVEAMKSVVNMLNEKIASLSVCDGATGTQASDIKMASLPSAVDFWLERGVKVDVVDHL